MTYQQYFEMTQHGGELFEKGELEGAMKVFQSLVENDLPELDRATMCVNVATVCDKMGHEGHALAWYDHGVGLERQYSRFFVAEKKAEYLAGKGRKAEALAIYEGLAGEPFLTMADLERVGHNVKVLRGEAGDATVAGRVGV